MGSWAERPRSKAAAGGPSEVADCGAGWTKLQLATEATAGGLGDRPTTQGSNTLKPLVENTRGG